jgi:protein tyrosine phosphatase
MIANLRQVSRILWRGAKPAAADMASLRSLGITKIIDLEIYSLFEWFFSRRSSLAYRHISCKPWHPEDEDVAAFLSEASRPGVTFVHCRQGSDRTGMMVAAYRIAAEHWTNQAAIDEMVGGGFGFHGDAWPQIVPYIRAMNGSAIVQLVGKRISP